jgi:hypothetical protein
MAAKFRLDGRSALGALTFSCALAALVSCGHLVLTPQIFEPERVPRTDPKVPILKAHMKTGELYVLTAWRVSPDGSQLDGTGTRYSLARVRGTTGAVSISTDDVALFETNRSEHVGAGSTGALAVMTTVFGTLTAICLADPKSCFGSCPTFYLDAGGPNGRPVAEGFSASIARALEARDVDAIGAGPPAGGRFAITMRNEAYETHAVRRVRLLAAERPAAGRILAAPGELYYPAFALAEPISCSGAEGDCLAAVRAKDGIERFSRADAEDLAAREMVELDFAPAAGRVGLVIAARQTLLSTHLFYQTLAYFGSHAGEYLASLERGGPEAAERAMGMARALGGIDVSVSEGRGPWRAIGSFDEPGPIAGDVLVLPFDASGGPLRVRLRQAKGHWRLDQVALARLGEPVTPRPLEPVAVERGSRPDGAALDRLRHGERHLITRPGDAYQLVFELPASPHGLELFLESEGYYYEWMREPWLAEENPEMAALVLSSPSLALRRLAGSFKEREDDLERAFWASRFRKEPRP